MDLRGVEAALLDRTHDIVVVLDGSGGLQYANSAVERVLGYTVDEVRGWNVFEHIHPDDRARVEATFQRLVEAGPRDADALMTSPTEFRYRAADGSWTWLAARMSTEPVLSSEQYVVSCRDISARRGAEAEYRRIHELLLAITEHTNDVLWMFAADWREVLFINTAYEAMWGRSVESLEADPTEFVRGIHPADRKRVQAAMARLSSGDSISLECRVDASNSYRTWVQLQGYPLVDDGQVASVVGFAHDVTDRRERERQLLVMDRLLRHNLRNEMNLILGYAEEARANGGSAVDADVSRIVETGEHLLRTVDKERDIVGLLTNDPERVTVDLVSVVTDLCERVRACHPTVTITETLPETADVRAVLKLSLAVYELLTNAIEHADSAHPTVELSVTVERGTVTLAVSDECPPIPTQEIRILRGERDVRSVYHGSGLGLWLAYWAVDRSGGELTFRTDDRGNTVSISLAAEE